jgi:peroxiredoxin
VKTKQWLLTAISFIMVCIHANSQSLESKIATDTSAASKPKPGFKLNAKAYVIPGGKSIPPNKLDSVQKSWGNVALIMHIGDDPDTIYITPEDSTFLKKQAANEHKLQSMLNQQAPDFTVTDMKGISYHLADLKNKVVVLNFWFTTCGTCIAEMPALNKIKAEYDPSKVVFLGLGRDDAATIQKFLKQHSFRYNLIPDAAKVHDAYNIFACPISVVIDKTGKISAIIDGADNVENLLPAGIDAAIL